MKVHTLLILFSAIILLSGCQQSKSSQPSVTVTAEEPPSEHYAKLVVSPTIDLGVFEGDNMRKTATLLLTNMGTDTLHILGAQPECDCTTLQVLDSTISPHSNGRLEVTLDLTGYPNDTIYKEVAIISNDIQEHVKRFNLKGLVK